MKPIFAKGKTEICDTTGTLQVDDTEIPVTNASQHFTAGDLIFLADSDFSGVECLGFATAVSSSAITVLFGIKTARAVGAKVWKPTNYFQWEIGRSSPLKRSYFSGTEILETAGGIIYSTKIADSKTIEQLIFNRISVIGFSTYESWVKNTLSDGLYSFTYVDEERDVFKVRILNPDVLRVEESPGLVELMVNLGIEDEDVYE